MTYTVVNSQNKKEKLALLQGVGGYLLPGEMAALMGCALRCAAPATPAAPALAVLGHSCACLGRAGA